jgi:DNA-binding transcriptional LysR family regulator
MRVRLDQLEALVWIARLGSFRAAARRLNISQPAVSGRIRELERQTGVVVLDRAQLRPRVTRRGTEIVRFAEQMLLLSEKLAALLSARHELVGTIRLGAADSFALTHLSALLARIAQRYPALHVEVDIDFSVNLDRKLRAGELDIAFLHAPTPGPTISIASLMDIELAWFASPELRLPRRRLTAPDLVDVPILTNPRPSHLYQTVTEWFGAAGLVPKRMNTCNSLAIMTKLTVDGFGIAPLPAVLVGAELKRGTLRRLNAHPALPPGLVTVAYRTDPDVDNLSGIVELVREILRDSK